MRSEQAGTKKGWASAGSAAWPWGAWWGRLRPGWQGEKVARGTSQWDQKPESGVPGNRVLGNLAVRAQWLPGFGVSRPWDTTGVVHRSVQLLQPQGRHPGLGPTRTSRTGKSRAREGRGRFLGKGCGQRRAEP